MPDGRYLIEKYNIKYTQSLTVMEIIEKRNYSNTRKSMIAFGGSIYDEITYKKDMVETEQELANLKKEISLAANRGQSTRDAYLSLGFGKWINLPGTLAEVNAIKTIVSDADLYTGKDADESVIKSLSVKGDLKNYKVLHFATHGLVVPEMPELSALVLSQYQDEKNGEDGYLRMQEIAALDINADFVNLSACETGLGKIYDGEGVVGLIQSFLLAGANGLSVSLWQVDDKSTMEFMVGVYKKVNKNKMSYDKAIAEMKREFIRGKYSSPFYWAPFVYYGK
jgi:CHAT domain-containing protein